MIEKICHVKKKSKEPEKTGPPLACITFKCKKCKNSKQSFGVYDMTYSQTTKPCHNCGAITVHIVILPTDDNKKHYRRPSLF
jgi:transcription elongation factor Elf1